MTPPNPGSFQGGGGDDFEMIQQPRGPLGINECHDDNEDRTNATKPGEGL